MSVDVENPEVSGESSHAHRSTLKDSLVMQDVFQVTGYSHKPFYKLDTEQVKSLSKKKDLIFFKGVLIRGNEVTTRKAIVDMDWIHRKRDLWPGKPITVLHPEFKGKVAMNGREDSDVVKDMLAYQEKFGVGRIMKVDSNISDPNLVDFYGYIDNPGLVKGIDNGEIQLPRYGSPYIWALGKIDETNFDPQGNFYVRDHYPIHWAFVPKPAMGPSVEVKAMCKGEELECIPKLQGFSDPSEYNQPVCPCTVIKENFAPNEQIDNSFYLSDPITQLSIMTDPSINTATNKDEEAKKFMNEGVKNKNSSMPEVTNPDGEQGPPNPGEHVDRDKAAEVEKDKPEDKPEIEKLIEDVRVKAEKATAKKYEKTIIEKDAEISKRDKIISDLQFKEKESIINESLPDELFGGKEEDKKLASEEREFYTKLAKDKGLSPEELTKILGRNTKVLELQVKMGSGSNKKGQANAGEDITATRDNVRDYMLGNGDTGNNSNKSRTIKNNSDGSLNKEAIREFFGQ